MATIILKHVIEKDHVNEKNEPTPDLRPLLKDWLHLKDNNPSIIILITSYIASKGTVVRSIATAFHVPWTTEWERHGFLSFLQRRQCYKQLILGRSPEQDWFREAFRSEYDQDHFRQYKVHCSQVGVTRDTRRIATIWHGKHAPSAEGKEEYVGHRPRRQNWSIVKWYRSKNKRRMKKAVNMIANESSCWIQFLFYHVMNHAKLATKLEYSNPRNFPRWWIFILRLLLSVVD